MMSHYEVLGLSVGASAAAIRKAYRERAKHEHPDKGGSDERFQRLQQAFEVLADTGARRQYDRTVRQQHEVQRAQATARKREQERLAKEAAQRARFVAQQRQWMMQQAGGPLRGDGWAAQPSPAGGSRGAEVRQQRRVHRNGQKPTVKEEEHRDVERCGPHKSRGDGPRAACSVYAGVTGMDGEATDVFSRHAYRQAARNHSTSGSCGAEVSPAFQQQGCTTMHDDVPDYSPQAARRILYEGIRRWTTPYKET